MRYLPDMQRLVMLARRYGADVLIAVAAVESAVEVAVRRGEPEAPTIVAGLAVPGVLLVILPLLARRRFRFGAPAATLLIGSALSFVDGRLVVFTAGTYAAGLAAAFLLGNARDASRAWTGLAIAAGGAVIIVSNNPIHTVSALVFTPILFSLLWLAGFTVRERGAAAEAAEERAARLEKEQEAEALRAVAEERTRIARELHDIVGHSISVMTVQASGVRRLLRPDQEKEREALLSVERTGREALAEMRRVVGALRDPEESPQLAPSPSLSRVDRLVEQARGAGLPVELLVEGEPVALPPGVDLAAYRLIQEGLTNTLRHASASRAQVLVRYDGEHIEVEVSDDGRGAGAASTENGGHGLVGIRERVSIYGGELEAGPRPEGGFRLRARLPVTT